ncbi:SMP-30/gluconolactonase/LRE family protein [Echinicola sp. CAU 1574]|uniref:SMP-30/gluconolactonase/LRE family protein n=1 Tax=Echinicola arenosa TaxID=2774144 RepID=A0ABR9ANA4_9BACT|nr:SMP-30/gluconolactonase/LRE family protein [Echinicola arenosa]MBD8490195.1 SMP-30/gluconolactonase/LRE family protein [Echinicola arenosa]
MKNLSIFYFLIAFSLLFSCKSSQELLYTDGPTPALVADGFAFTEGPAVAPNGDIYFTDQPNNRIHLWSAETGKVTVYMENAGRANGLFFDQEGNLLACADEKFQLWQIDKNKNVKILVDGFEEKDFNGPNDLWVDQKGGIYFTDPYYQREYWERQKMEMESQRVYYRNPENKEVKVVADHFVRPNGIIGTKDGKTLYIADIGDKKTYKYTVHKDGSLGEPQLFTALGSDGMTIDEKGNVYLTSNGVTVFNPQGQQIGHIPVPQKWTANVTFGGKDRKTLFITASTAVYTVDMNIKGAK